VDQSSSVNQAIQARRSATATTPRSNVKSVAGVEPYPCDQPVGHLLPFVNHRRGTLRRH
jgi:hypothetical protein